MSSDRSAEITGTAAGFLALAWFTIFLRCYCRVAIVKSFGLDDWLAVIATIFYTFYCAFALSGAYYGSGKLTEIIPPQNVPKGLKWWWACEPVYILSAMALKLSIGVFLYRICVSRVHKIIIYVAEALMCAMSIGYFFVFIFQCSPSAYFWTRLTGATGKCLATSVVVNVAYGFSAVSCLVDWTLGILPVFLVWNLQMNGRTKLSVAAILALGAVASTATIVRIPYIHNLSNLANFLYATTDVAIWSTAEVGIGIAASSIACLRPLFRTLYERTHLSSGSGGKTSGQWPTGVSRSGYLRSTGNEGIALNLRSDGLKNGTVTTTICTGKTDADKKKARQSRSTPRKSEGDGEWSRNENRFADDSSEDVEWSRGITKTMVISVGSTDQEMV